MRQPQHECSALAIRGRLEIELEEGAAGRTGFEEDLSLARPFVPGLQGAFAGCGADRLQQRLAVDDGIETGKDAPLRARKRRESLRLANLVPERHGRNVVLALDVAF